MTGTPAGGLIAQIFIEDSDAPFERTARAGTTVITPMTDMFFGIREGSHSATTVVTQADSGQRPVLCVRRAVPYNRYRSVGASTSAERAAPTTRRPDTSRSMHPFSA